jgi:hypothetical protein
VGGQLHAPTALPPGKTRYPFYRRLGGPQGPSGGVWKIPPPLVFDPRTVQLVASRYTDWVIPAHTFNSNSLNLYFGNTRFEPVLFLTGQSMGVFSLTSRVSWIVPLNTHKPRPEVSVLVGCNAVSGERFQTFEMFACFSSWDCLLLKVMATRSFETSRTTHPAVQHHVAEYPNPQQHLYDNPKHRKPHTPFGFQIQWENFSSLNMSRPALKPTQPRSGLFPGVKRQVHDVDHWPHRDEAKNEWSYTAPPRQCFRGIYGTDLPRTQHSWS